MSNGSYGANNPSLNNDKLSHNMTLRSGNYNGMGNSGRDDMQTNRQDQAVMFLVFFLNNNTEFCLQIEIQLII